MKKIGSTLSIISCLVLMTYGHLGGHPVHTINNTDTFENEIDPITLGLLFIGINSTIEKLNGLVNNVSEQSKQVINQATNNATSFVTDAETRYKGSLQLTFEKLDAETQQVFNRATSLLTSLNLVVDNAGNLTKEILIGADIMAYDALYSLPGRDQNPRIMGITPNKIRIGEDLAEVTISGNYLDLDPQNLNLKIGDTKLQAANIMGVSSTSIRIQIPIAIVNSIMKEQSVKISLTPAKKSVNLFRSKIVKGQEKSISVIIAPKRSILLSVKITPSYIVPEYKEFSSGDMNEVSPNCSDYNKTFQWCVQDAGWEVYNGDAYEKTGNKNNATATSRIIQKVRQGNCFTVIGEIRSCHGFAGFCCGTGWLGIEIKMQAKNWQQPKKSGPEYTSNEMVDASKASVTWNYSNTYALPGEYRNIEWDYTVDVVIKEQGTPDRKFSVSRTVPTDPNGIVSGISPTGSLTAQFNLPK
ncbi:MAG TPA: IPT/TIG domain-containing protein [Cyclobacteriaceae bacterium]|nr:IPT/TIG domain-containing protein [Cyclobacteriaceae bacterium]